jgi:uncharacterized Zn-binding protein involved in type VI secretion
MSKQVVGSYQFNPANKTIALTDYGSLAIERLQLIVNVTQNLILYNFADASVAQASITGNVITLSTVQNSNPGDKLQILYDSASGDPLYSAEAVTLKDAISKDTSSITTYPRGYNYKVLTGNGVISDTPCKIHGLVVNSGSPTISIYDDPAAAQGGNPNNGLTPTAGQYVNLGDARMKNGAYATIAGTANVTFYYDPTN